MGSEFIAEGIVVAGISLGVVVSLIISILKNWFKLEGKVINLLNVVLGIVAVTIYAVIEGSMTLPNAIIFAIGVAFSSTLFHENFGHAMEVILEFLGKSQEGKESGN
jgi:hypothetical protein